MRGTTSKDTGPWFDVRVDGRRLLDPAPWNRLYATVDPYSQQWLTELQAGARSLAVSAWQNLVRAFPPGASAEAVARNTWVLLKRQDSSLPRLLEAVLLFAVPEENGIRKVVADLRSNRGSGPAIPDPHWIEVLLGSAGIEPDGQGIGGLQADLALNYVLAESHRRGLTRAQDLVALLDKYSSVSRWSMGRSLQAFLAHQHLEPLPPKAVKELSPRIAMLLAEQSDLKAALLGVAEDVTPQPLRAVQRRWRPYRKLRKILRSLIPAVRRRDWATADGLAQQLLDMRWQPAAFQGLKDQLVAAIRSPEPAAVSMAACWPTQYRSISRALKKLAPEVSATRLLTTAPESIAARAARSPKYRVRQVLAAEDFAVLQGLWGPTVYSQLFRAGRFDLLPENFRPLAEADLRALLRHIQRPGAKGRFTDLLRDPEGQAVVTSALRRSAVPLRRILVDVGRKRPNELGFLIPYIGTPVTRSVLADKALDSAAFLQGAIEFWARQAESPAKSKAVKVILDSVASLKRSRDFGDLGRQCLELGPRVPRLLGARIGAEQLERVLPAPLFVSTAHGSRQVVPGRLHAEAVIAGVGLDDPVASWEAVRKQPKFVDVIRALPWPPVSADSSPAEAAIAAVVASGNWHDVRALADALGPDGFAAAVTMAKPVLPARSRRVALLELATCLPRNALGSLARASGAARFSAAHGCAMDDCYKTYQLPKRSGGSRTIAVPAVWLRFLQRAIYEHILEPLGAHRAAHGFVRGRSIVTNAAAHVGQPVVVNCDIVSCFPSVRWSLVLATLKRDLGDRFAPATISLLTDLCCYKGALPIGAPTSPALLNRVMLNTDTFIAEQARRRDCSYTRYADDLTFSGDDRAVALLRLTASSLTRIGLALDPKKTNIYRGGRRQMVTGLVVNQQVSVPRRLRRRMRAAVHAVEQGREPTWHGDSASLSSLRGRLAFTQAVNPEEMRRLLHRLEAVADK